MKMIGAAPSAMRVDPQQICDFAGSGQKSHAQYNPGPLIASHESPPSIARDDAVLVSYDPRPQRKFLRPAGARGSPPSAQPRLLAKLRLRQCRAMHVGGVITRTEGFGARVGLAKVLNLSVLASRGGRPPAGWIYRLREIMRACSGEARVAHRCVHVLEQLQVIQRRFALLHEQPAAVSLAAAQG